MAARRHPLPLLAVASVLIAAGSSEILKLKSNPFGNFAIGFEKGFINSGHYAVIVPEGDVEYRRKVRIRGPGVRDSVEMIFNAHTMVFSDWADLFMVGNRVYSDKPGTLYFMRQDHKCNKRVYQTQRGVVVVIDEQTLDKDDCDEVRAKVESALHNYLKEPYSFLRADAPPELKNAPGFPGGDYITGVLYGTYSCGQHTVELPSGDSSRERTIKVSGPGMSDEIKMKVDVQTKMFGSWNGLFYLGDKVFSDEPNTLVVQTKDGSCVKKTFGTQGSQIIIAHQELLKEESCFIIKSGVFSALQKHIEPPSMILEEDRHLTMYSQQTQKPQNPQQEPQKPEGPIPIHVSSTVVLPGNGQSQSQLLPVGSSIFKQQSQIPDNTVSNLQTNNVNSDQNVRNLQTNDIYVPGSTVQTISSPIIVNSNPTLQQQELAPSDASSIVPNPLDGTGDIHTSGMFMPDGSLQDSSNPIILTADDLQQYTGLTLPGQVTNLFDDNLGQENTISNIQTNDIALQDDDKILTRASNDMYEPYDNYQNSPNNFYIRRPEQNVNFQNSAGDLGQQRRYMVQQRGNTLTGSGSPTYLQSIDPTQEVVLPDGLDRFSRSVAVENDPQSGDVLNYQSNNVNLKQPGDVTNIQNNDVMQQYTLPQQVIIPDSFIRVGKQLITGSQPNNVVNFQENKVDMTHSGQVTNIQNNNVKSQLSNKPYFFNIINPNQERDNPRNFQRKRRSINMSNGDSGGVLNIQTNKVDVGQTGKVTNIQNNDVKSNGSPIRLDSNPLIIKGINPIQHFFLPRKYIRLGRGVQVNVHRPGYGSNVPTDEIIPNHSAVTNIKLHKTTDSQFGHSLLDTQSTQALKHDPHLVSSSGPNGVFNIQTNDIIAHKGRVTNIQANKVETGDYYLISDHNPNQHLTESANRIDSSNRLNRVRRNAFNEVQIINQGNGNDKTNEQFYIPNSNNYVPGDALIYQPYTASLYQSEPATGPVKNIQTNTVNLEQQGNIMNIQKNNVNENRETGKALTVQPDRFQQLQDIPQTGHVQNIQTNTVDLDHPGDVQNIQINDVKMRGSTLQAGRNQLLLQDIDPSQQIVLTDGSVRLGRSIAPGYIRPQVISSQVTNIDGSKGFATHGNEPNKIVSVQDNNMLSPSDVKATQVTTVTLPRNGGSSQSEPNPMYIDTKITLNQDNSQTNKGRPVYFRNNEGRLIRLDTTRGNLGNLPLLFRMNNIGGTSTSQRRNILLSNGQSRIFLRPQDVNGQRLTSSGPGISRINSDGTIQVNVDKVDGSTVINSLLGKGKTGKGHNVILDVNGRPSDSPYKDTSGGHIPISFMKDLRDLKSIYNPEKLIVNIAQNTNFEKVKK